MLNIHSRLYSAILKSVSGRLSIYVIQFGFLAIYARIFSPEEFGVIASIQVFVNFFQMIADVGIGPAILNEDTFEQKRRDGIFTVTFFIGLLLAPVFYLFSFLLNNFYSGYEYQNIAIFVCITIFFSSINILPNTALVKDTKFIHIAGVAIWGEVLAFIGVFALYKQGFNILALAAKPAIQSVIVFFASWLLSKKTEIGRAKIGRELFHIKSILAFSMYQFGFNFINYFSRNLDNILIGKYFGMGALGIYDKSYQLMRYPLMITTFAMTPAIQPVLTKIREDKQAIVKEHNLLTSRLLALSLPISFYIFFNSKSIVLFMFGKQWLEVTPLIEVLSFVIPIQAVLSTSGSFFQVMNKPRLLFISGCLSTVVSVAAIITGVMFGEIICIAMAVAISFTFNFFQAYYLLFRYCFFAKQSIFYLTLFKALIVISLPLIGYAFINVSGFLLYDISPFLDLLVNGVAMLIMLIVFIKPIKHFLLNR